MPAPYTGIVSAELDAIEAAAAALKLRIEVLESGVVEPDEPGYEEDITPPQIVSDAISGSFTENTIISGTVVLNEAGTVAAAGDYTGILNAETGAYTYTVPAYDAQNATRSWRWVPTDLAGNLGELQYNQITIVSAAAAPEIRSFGILPEGLIIDGRELTFDLEFAGQGTPSFRVYSGATELYNGPNTTYTPTDRAHGSAFSVTVTISGPGGTAMQTIHRTITNSPPVVQGDSIGNLKTLLIPMSDEMNPASIPDPSTVVVTAPSFGAQPASDIAILSSPPMLRVLLANGFEFGEAATFAYTKPTENPLVNLDGEPLASFSGQVIVNETAQSLPAVRLVVLKGIAHEDPTMPDRAARFVVEADRVVAADEPAPSVLAADGPGSGTLKATNSDMDPSFFSGRLVPWVMGTNRSQEYTIVAKDDAGVEEDESFSTSISGAVNCIVAPGGSFAYGVIRSNDNSLPAPVATHFYAGLGSNIRLGIYYDTKLNAASLSASTDYAVTVNGLAREVVGVGILPDSAAPDTKDYVWLDLAAPFDHDDVIRGGHTPGATPIRGANGVAAGGFDADQLFDNLLVPNETTDAQPDGTTNTLSLGSRTLQVEVTGQPGKPVPYQLDMNGEYMLIGAFTIVSDSLAGTAGRHGATKNPIFQQTHGWDDRLFPVGMGKSDANKAMYRPERRLTFPAQIVPDDTVVFAESRAVAGTRTSVANYYPIHCIATAVTNPQKRVAPEAVRGSNPLRPRGVSAELDLDALLATLPPLPIPEGKIRLGKVVDVMSRSFSLSSFTRIDAIGGYEVSVPVGFSLSGEDGGYSTDLAYVWTPASYYILDPTTPAAERKKLLGWMIAHGRDYFFPQYNDIDNIMNNGGGHFSSQVIPAQWALWALGETEILKNYGTPTKAVLDNSEQFGYLTPAHLALCKEHDGSNDAAPDAWKRQKIVAKGSRFVAATKSKPAYTTDTITVTFSGFFGLGGCVVRKAGDPNTVHARCTIDTVVSGSASQRVVDVTTHATLSVGDLVYFDAPYTLVDGQPQWSINGFLLGDHPAPIGGYAGATGSFGMFVPGVYSSYRTSQNDSFETSAILAAAMGLKDEPFWGPMVDEVIYANRANFPGPWRDAIDTTKNSSGYYTANYPNSNWLRVHDIHDMRFQAAFVWEGLYNTDGTRKEVYTRMGGFFDAHMENLVGTERFNRTIGFFPVENPVPVPVITSAATATGTYTAQATLAGGAITYSILGGRHGHLFTINPTTGVVTPPSVPGTYDVIVGATGPNPIEGYFRSIPKRVAFTVPVTASNVPLKIGVVGSSTMNAAFFNDLGEPSDPLVTRSLSTSPTSFSTCGGLAMRRIGKALRARYNRPIQFVKCTQGGTSVAGWDAAGNEDMQTTINAFQAVGGVDLILFQLGFNDASGGTFTTQAEHETRLRSVLAKLRAAAGGNVPIFMGYSQKSASTTLTTAAHARFDMLYLAEDAVEKDANNFFGAQQYDQPQADTIHMTDAGYGPWGDRYVANIIRGLDGLSSAYGPRMTGLAATTSTITVTLTHSVATNFTPSSGITSFEFSLDGFATAPLSVGLGVRASANTVTFTPTANLPAGATLSARLLRGGNPSRTAPILDNFNPPMPIQPHPTARTAVVSSGGTSTPTPTPAASDTHELIKSPNLNGLRTGLPQSEMLDGFMMLMEVKTPAVFDGTAWLANKSFLRNANGTNFKAYQNVSDGFRFSGIAGGIGHSDFWRETEANQRGVLGCYMDRLNGVSRIFFVRADGSVWEPASGYSTTASQPVAAVDIATMFSSTGMFWLGNGDEPAASISRVLFHHWIGAGPIGTLADDPTAFSSSVLRPLISWGNGAETLLPALGFPAGKAKFYHPLTLAQVNTGSVPNTGTVADMPLTPRLSLDTNPFVAGS